MVAAYVYMTASGRNGTIYLGRTTNLPKRAWEHRHGVADGFTKRYGCKRLIRHEAQDDLEAACRRILQMKEWKRVWKLREIEGLTPEWNDLYDGIATP